MEPRRAKQAKRSKQDQQVAKWSEEEQELNGVKRSSMLEEKAWEVNNKQLFGHNGSFFHKLDYASDQKLSFTKVVQFGLLIMGMLLQVNILHFIS